MTTPGALRGRTAARWVDAVWLALPVIAIGSREQTREHDALERLDLRQQRAEFLAIQLRHQRRLRQVSREFYAVSVQHSSLSAIEPLFLFLARPMDSELLVFTSIRLKSRVAP